MTSDTGSAEHKGILDQHRQAITDMSLLEGIVLHCRTSRRYDPGIWPEHSELNNAVVQLLHDAGGDEKVGQALSGNLER